MREFGDIFYYENSRHEKAFQTFIKINMMLKQNKITNRQLTISKINLFRNIKV